ncbi:MAG: DUF11 domain-containing protein [Planctomycetes bacterium]|nr:DUF11 domain-containing protein [Planctomycetota bacterium]
MRRWQLCALAVAGLALSACTAMPTQQRVMQQKLAERRALDQQLTGNRWHHTPPVMAPGGGICSCHGCESGVPAPYNVACNNPWTPSGLACPWPSEEYVCDGGDLPPPAEVTKEYEILGINPTDTVAAYESLDGRTLIEPSNRVCIYAPRFGAVRSVARLVSSEQIDLAMGAAMPTRIARYDMLGVPVDHKQNEKAVNQLAPRMPETYEMRQLTSFAQADLPLLGLHEMVLPFEGRHLMGIVKLEGGDEAILIQANRAAQAWATIDAPQVMLERSAAEALVDNTKAQIVYTVKDLRHSPKLCLTKVASTQTANPGDEVHFALRFENTGDQPIGNIAIIDRLSPRLEYIDQSAQASVAAHFETGRNETGALVLRWELEQPLEPGQGGVVTFRCRVR